MLQTSGFCGTATGPVASACALRLRCAAKPPAAKKLCRWLERRPMPGVWLAQQRGHDKLWPQPRQSDIQIQCQFLYNLSFFCLPLERQGGHFEITAFSNCLCREPPLSASPK